MVQLIVAILLAILLAISMSLSGLPDKYLDGPGPPITKVLPLGYPDTFDFSCDNPILLVDGPAGAVGGASSQSKCRS